MARIGLSGWITEEARYLLFDACAASHPFEIGGIVAGVLVEGRPWITHVKEIPSQVSGHSSYVLPAGKTSPAVAALQAIDPRVGYLGDWHSHPADAGASSLDFRTLRQTSQDNDARMPLLIIVRRGRLGIYSLDVHAWARIQSRRVHLADSGPLPGLDHQGPSRARARSRSRG